MTKIWCLHCRGNHTVNRLGQKLQFYFITPSSDPTLMTFNDRIHAILFHQQATEVSINKRAEGKSWWRKRLPKAKIMWMNDEKAEEMSGKKMKGRKREKQIGCAIVGPIPFHVCVCVCVSHPGLDVGLLLLEASEGLLSQSHSIGQQFSVTQRAMKWEQLHNIQSSQPWFSLSWRGNACTCTFLHTNHD